MGFILTSILEKEKLMEKITITIAGSPEPLAKFFKHFNTQKLPDTVIELKEKKLLTKKSLKVINKSLHHYSQKYSDKSIYKQIFLKKENLKLANKYISENKDIKFFELSNYIKNNNKSNKPPSQLALKNFLIKKKYKKYKLYYDNKTSVMVWQKGQILNYKDYFEKIKISNTTISFRWDLNKVPTGCDQILLLAQLINQFKNLNKEIKLRPDKRKRAKGLIVIFINDKPEPTLKNQSILKKTQIV